MTLDLDAARARLHDRRRQLLARYRGALDRIDEELDSREIESVENATELWDARFNSVMSDVDAHALQQVIGALVRIDEGAYGTCVVCGEAIDEARLAAVPETLYCARDAEEKEIEDGPRAAPRTLA